MGPQLKGTYVLIMTAKYSVLISAPCGVYMAHTEIGLGVWRAGTRSAKAFKIT